MGRWSYRGYAVRTALRVADRTVKMFASADGKRACGERIRRDDCGKSVGSFRVRRSMQRMDAGMKGAWLSAAEPRETFGLGVRSRAESGIKSRNSAGCVSQNG